MPHVLQKKVLISYKKEIIASYLYISHVGNFSCMQLMLLTFT